MEEHTRKRIDMIPLIAMRAKEARDIVASDGLERLTYDISKKLIETNLTPLQAQAVLVRAWADLMLRGRITDHRPTVEKEGSQLQT